MKMMQWLMIKYENKYPSHRETDTDWKKVIASQTKEMHIPRQSLVNVLILNNRNNLITIQEENGLPTKKQNNLALNLSFTTLNLNIME